MLSMFPVVHPKTAMPEAVFFFFFFFFFNYYFIELKTAKRTLFINRTGRYTHTDNYIGRSLTFFSHL